MIDKFSLALTLMPEAFEDARAPTRSTTTSSPPDTAA